MSKLAEQYKFQELAASNEVFKEHYEGLLKLLKPFAENGTNNTLETVAMMRNHIKYLGRRKKVYSDTRKEAIGSGSFIIDEAMHPVLRKRLNGNITEIFTCLSTAHEDLTGDAFPEVLGKLTPHMAAFYKFLKDPKTAPAGSRAEQTYTKEKRLGGKASHFSCLDEMYEMMNSFALQETTQAGQEQAQYYVPDAVVRAQHIFVVSWLNAKYNLELSKDEIEFFGIGLSDLSKHPRGLTNPSMGEENKQRHNAAFHEMGSVILVDAVFDNSLQELTKSASGGDARLIRPMVARVTEMRRKFILAGLAHDLPEAYFKELSVGTDVANMPIGERGTFKEQRGQLEHESYRRTLAYVFNVMRKKGGYGLKKEKALELKAKIEEAVEFAEVKETAKRKSKDGGQMTPEETQEYVLSALFEAIEKIHSNLDYLKWNGTGGGVPLNKTTERDKDFSLNYVIKVLYGTSISDTRSEHRAENIDDKPPEEIDEITAAAQRTRTEKLLKLKPDPEKSLAALIKSLPPSVEAKIIKSLYGTVEKEFASMWKRYSVALGIEPADAEKTLKNLTNPRGVGAVKK